MNLFELATRGVDLASLPDEPAPRERIAFEPSANTGKFSVPSDLNAAFDAAANDFGIDPDVLRAVAFAESRFRPDIISGEKRSSAGAIGLMQFMPETADEYGINPTDPVESIFGAAAYLRKSLDKFGGDYGKAVASYNAGPNRKAFDAADWDQRMPAETQGYLRTVFTAADQLKSGKAERPLPSGVAPSTAGAGRGVVNPGMVNTQDVQAVTPPVDTLDAKLAKQGEFSPLEESGKGLQSGYTGLKQMWEANAVLKDSVLANSMAQRISAFDRIDAGAKDVPRAIGLAYQQADAAGRAKIRADVQSELSSRKDFIGASMETIRQYQAEQQRTKGRTTDLTDVGNLKDFGNWLTFNGASGVVSMAPLMVAAVATGPAAPLVTGAMGVGMATGELTGDRIKFAQDKLSAQRFSRNPDRYDDAVRAENQNVTDYVAKTAGSTVGAAIPFAALDVVAGPVGSLLKGAGKEVAQKGVKWAAKEVGKDTLEETATGGIQEVIKILTENALGEQDGVLTGENLKRVINSAAAEGAGGAVGGAGRVGYQSVTRPSAPTVESQPTTPTVPPVAPTAPAADATQAVDNIAALLRQTEENIDGASPVDDWDQTLAEINALSDGSGQSESAQSLTDAPLTNDGTTAPTQAVAPAVNPITESMQVARQMADRKGLTAGIQTQLSKGKSIAQATKAMRDDFDEAGIPREEHLTFVHHVSKTLASQPTQQTNPTTQAAPAPDIGAEMAAMKERNQPAASQQAQPQIFTGKSALSDGSGQSESAGALTQQPVLQNRDRSNPASITQMQSIASNPDYGRLGFSRDFANGAPVVAGAEQNVPAQQRGKQDTAVAVDGTRIPVQYAVVDAGEVLTSNNVDGTSNTAYGDANTPAIRAIAGNGRVAGLTAAYRQGTAAQYKQELMADTALHGVPAEVIQGMQNPVLVRVMPQSSVTANIGDLSNTQGNLSLSAVEQAKNDVSRVNLAALEFDEAGGLTQKAVRQFVQAMPKAEQGGLIDTNGQPSKQAVDRLQAAVFAKAYGNDQLVRLFAQAQDPEARLILSAMAQLAPKIARLEGAGALDIRPIIAQAAEIAVNARREGKSIALAAKQMDMAADPAVGVVLDLFASSPRSNKSIIEAIANAADFAYAEASKSDMDMFGEVQRASRDDVINQLKPQNERASQANLEQPTGRVAAENNAVGQQADTGTTADAGATEAGGPTQEANGQVNEPGAEYSVRQQFSLFGDEQSDQLQLFIDRGPDPVQAGPGAVAAQRDAVAAIADIQSVSSILAAALTRDYAARQRISLVGQRVASAEDLAVLAQVYRDPRFETFRVVFVDANNKVVSQLGLTSRLPASAAALVGTDTYAYLNGLSATAKKAGATGYYLLHNHPSGQARASTSDVRLTNTFEQHLPGLKFQSHVVIDTNEYSTIKGGFSNLIQKDFGQSPPLGATGVTFSSPDDVVAYAKSLQAESGAVTLIATDTQYRVKGVTTIPAAELNGPKGMLRLKVARALMRLQSSNVFAVGRESGALAKLSGIVVDAIHVEDSGRATSLTARGIINSTNLGVFPSDRRTRVTVDSSPEFAYLRFDPSAMKSAGQRVAEGDLFSPSANAWQSDLFGTPAPEPAKPKTETEAKAQREEQTPAITSPTPADIEAQQDRAKRTERTVKAEKTAADEQAKRERERKDIAQASVGAADSFELGQSAEDNLSGQEGLKFSRASDNKAARAALAKIMEKGVTSPDDLRDLLRVPGYSKWAESTITGDMAATTALRGELQQAFSGSDWKAPKLNDQGIISVYSDWDGFTAQNIDKLTKLADKYDAPIGVRGGAATKQLVNRLDGFGFELYNGLQERADRMPNVMFGMIRPAGGITATTPLFSRATQSPSTPVSTIRQAIAKAYGNLLARLEGNGLVSLTQTEEQAIAAAAQARADQNGGDVEVIKQSLRASVLASQRAWHGTPHRGIEKFSTDKIGTGEGAQAYGWGLYFAQKKSTAEWYRKELTTGDFLNYAGQFQTVDQRLAFDYLVDYVGDSDFHAGNPITQDALNAWADDVAEERGLYNIAEGMRQLDPKQIEINDNPGQLYEVDIPNDSDMLLWDKPLSEQTEAVRDAAMKAARKLYPRKDQYDDADLGRIKGEVLYQGLASYRFGGPKVASQYLASLGIKGIKYLDGQSRNKPLRDVKREFLAELPEDADFEEVLDLIGTGTFSDKNEAVIKALADLDWLGFDYPSQAISTALGNQLQNFDPSPELVQAVAATQDDSTYNYVVFSGDDVQIVDVKYSKDGNLEGFFDPATGKSFLIADNLTAESAPATLMHEVGIHRAAEGGGKMGAVIERAGGILRIERNNEFVQRVQSRMDEAGETSNEEAAAYIVTEYEKDRTNAPASVKQWIKDFIADVRAWLFTKGVLLKADQLTVADIAAVARANARSMARGGPNDGPGGGVALQMSGGKYQTPKFREDIPNEAWLQGKIRVASQSPRNKYGVPDMRSVTGYFSGNVLIPTRWAKDVPGQRGEQKNIRQDDLDAIRKIIRETGMMPLAENGKEYVPYIEIGYDGKPWVSEGNHRIMAASAEGLEYIQAEVRYFDGGQRLSGRWSPENLLDIFERQSTREINPSRAALPATLNIDGKDRPTTNSKGQPIHPTEEGVRNFYRWFADSRVVEEQGKPLVVYHGSLSFDGAAFDQDKLGSRTGASSAKKGFFFTSSADVANSYAEVIDDPFMSAFSFGLDDDGSIEAEAPSVTPAFLSIQNPLVHDFKGSSYRDASYSDLIDAALEEGRDGVVLKNTVDNVGSGVNPIVGDVYVAFNPTQIKSAIGNNGDFDGNNPDIRRSVRGGGQQAQQNLPLNAPSPAWMLPASTKTDALVYEIQDQKVDLKRTQEAIKAAGRTITEPFDARMAETLMPGRVAYRTETFLKTEVAPLMEAMAKNNVTQNELSDYLLARHAPERNAQIAKVNPDPDMQDGGAGTNSQGVRMTTQAANDYIAALTTGKRMVLQLLANKIDAITASTRDMLVREGLEKQSTMDAWTGAYKHYVPLFKDEAVESPAHPIGSGMSVTGSASKRAMGSEGEVTNMVAHILMQREAAITRAEKNRVAMSLYGLALSNPNQEVWTTIRPNMRADKIGAELAAMGVDPVEAEQGMQGVPTIRTINAVTGLVQETPNPMYKRLENALVVKVDGEDRVILFNAKNADAMNMARALKNQDGITKIDYSTGVISRALGFLSEVAGASSKTTNKIVEKTKWLNAANATRYLASINTQYNPAFGMVNVVRDIGGALVNLTTTGIADKKAKVLGDIPAAMKGIARDVRGDQARTPWSDLWVQFQEDGGRTGYRDLFIDPFKRAEAVQKDLDAMQRDGTASAGRVAHSILDLLDDFNTTLENGVRLSAYKAALDKGMSRPAAAKMARELTVDYNRKGRMGREIGPLYAFFNASVQGTARTVESLKGPAGKKIVAGGLMLGVIQSLMLAAAGFDDDEPPEFVKARAFIIPIGDKKYIAIPLQFGLNALPNTGRVITDLLMTGGKDAGKKTFDAVGEIMGSFNPLGGGNIFTAHGALTMVAPTVFDPAIDIGMNTNFAGAPIGKSRADWDTRPGAKLARESTQRSLTGQAYIGISKAINAASGGNEFKKGLASPTPEQVQYVFTTTGGGLYRELEKTLNIAGLKADGMEVKSRMIPLGGRFAGEADDQDTQRSRYYRNSERLAALEAELKGFDKADDEAAVKRIETERSDEVDLLGDYKHIRQAITKLNKLAADNINDVEMLKELDAERLELMRELNDSVRKLEKRSGLFKRD